MRALTQAQETMLNNIYCKFGESGGYGGIDALYRAIHQQDPYSFITREQVETYLNRQESYSLHRKVSLNVPRNMTYSPRINFQWSADLGEMREGKEHNEDVVFFLLVIDTFSRFVYTEPLKRKTAVATADALERIIKRGHAIPHVINTDSGKEFVNKTVSALLRKYKIHFFKSYGEHKASQAEAAIKTIKNLLWRYFDKNMTRDWLSQLQLVTATYNRTYNTAIKMSPEMAHIFPNDVKLSEAVLNRVNKNVRERRLPYLKVGDIVRVSLKILHKKGFEQNWSRGLYKIDTGPYYTIGGKFPLYLIKELNGEKILGGFQQKFLLKVNKKIFLDDFQHPIDHVIRKGAKKSLVRFLGYSERDDAWIPNSKIHEPYIKSYSKK